MAGEITFSGLASGIDSASIISQLMQVERIPIDRLESSKRDYESQASKWRSVKTKVSALQDAANDLRAKDDVLATKVGSSDEAVFTATGDGSASLGATSIQVTSLAQAEKTYSDAFATNDQTGLFGVGTLSIQVGTDTAIDVAIDATDTLESVAGKINSSGAALTAGVVFDGTSYRLRVTGDDTGTARGITFGEDGTLTLNLDEAANQIEAAADAIFTVDGFAMTRPTNSVADAIPGVTITLTGASSGPAATLKVERDNVALTEKAQKVIDKYNDLMSSINAEFAYSGVAKGPSSLTGDSTLRGLQGRLRSLAGGVVAGVTGPYTLLSQIGFDGSQDGTLELDAAKLDEAIATDPNAVVELLAGNLAGGVPGFIGDLDAMLEGYSKNSGGLISNRIDSLEGRGDDIDDQIARLELRLDSTETQLRREFATLEQIISGLQAQGNSLLASLPNLNA